jgi:ABC-type iron transport system FetAB permease component
MLGSTIPISILGTRFAMSVDPFWAPIQYSRPITLHKASKLIGSPLIVPVAGMLSGSAVSGVIISVDYVLKELQYVITQPAHDCCVTPRSRVNRDKVEVFLAFGASRTEACRPIVKEALRTALTPVINQMRYGYQPFRSCARSLNSYLTAFLVSSLSLE